MNGSRLDQPGYMGKIGSWLRSFWGETMVGTRQILPPRIGRDRDPSEQNLGASALAWILSEQKPGKPDRIRIFLEQYLRRSARGGTRAGEPGGVRHV